MSHLPCSISASSGCGLVVSSFPHLVDTLFGFSTQPREMPLRTHWLLLIGEQARRVAPWASPLLPHAPASGDDKIPHLNAHLLSKSLSASCYPTFSLPRHAMRLWVGCHQGESRMRGRGRNRENSLAPVCWHVWGEWESMAGAPCPELRLLSSCLFYRSSSSTAQAKRWLLKVSVVPSTMRRIWI